MTSEGLSTTEIGVWVDVREVMHVCVMSIFDTLDPESAL